MKKIALLMCLVCAAPSFADEEKLATVALTTTTAVLSPKLGPGRYLIFCDLAFFYEIGNSSVVATTASGTPIAAQTPWEVTINNDSNGRSYISFVQSVSANNNCQIKKVF
jgi:hypothetical protein